MEWQKKNSPFLWCFYCCALRLMSEKLNYPHIAVLFAVTISKKERKKIQIVKNKTKDLSRTLLFANIVSAKKSFLLLLQQSFFIMTKFLSLISICSLIIYPANCKRKFHLHEAQYLWNDYFSSQLTPPTHSWSSNGWNKFRQNISFWKKGRL